MYLAIDACSSPCQPAAKKTKAGASAAPVVERGPTGKPKRRPDQPKKIKLRDQKLIPVPTTAFAEEGQGSDSDDDSELDVGGDEGLEYLQSAAGFLGDIDAKALSR
jgi:nucleolar complex protein 3